MTRGKIVRNDIICCPECLYKKKIKRFSRPMDLNQHLAKKHLGFRYKIVPMKKLDRGFSWKVRTKLN